MDTNPYASPQVSQIREEATDDESVRRAHLSHEASVKSIGSLYLISAGLLLIALPLVIVNATAPLGSLEVLVPVSIFGAFFALSAALAYGLIRLRPWARWSAVALGILGLLSFPVGTLINAYVLYLLFSKKSGVVFSADYHRVIAATPHIKYRTSRLVWMLLLFFVGLVIVGIIAALFLG